MFALIWPLELGLAAQSRGLLPFQIPPVLAPSDLVLSRRQ
jgi:hypothetical protein